MYKKNLEKISKFNLIDNQLLGMDKICNLLDVFKSEIISVLGEQMREINNKVDINTKKIIIYIQILTLNNDKNGFTNE